MVQQFLTFEGTSRINKWLVDKFTIYFFEAAAYKMHVIDDDIVSLNDFQQNARESKIMNGVHASFSESIGDTSICLQLEEVSFFLCTMIFPILHSVGILRVGKRCECEFGKVD